MYESLNNQKKAQAEKKADQGIQQLSQKTSSACMAYGLAKISFGSVQKVSDKASKDSDCVKTLNLFYLSVDPIYSIADSPKSFIICGISKCATKSSSGSA